VAEGGIFFGRYWPEARAVADASKRFYNAFGVGQGGAKEIFGPGSLVAGARAALKGNVPGKAVGDPWTMPGLFMVERDAILWQHTFRHAGDHPDFGQIPQQVAKESNR
jgi:hypothetical protein